MPPTEIATSPMPLADAGQVQLSYQRSGSGPPLLLIMGMSGTSLHWGEPLLAPLRESFEVIVYDHRGVGASTRFKDAFTIADLAADAAGLLGALGLERAHVLGFSMGGMVAQELALAHPQLPITLTLGGTYCGGEGSALTSPEVAQRLSEGTMSGDRELAVRTGWEVNVSPRLAADEQAFARFRAIGLERPVALAVILAQMRAIARHDTSARLPALELPTLVMHGTLDQMLPVQNGRMIAGLIPGAKLELLEGDGHLYFWEEPERSAELLRAHAGV
jgi:pimeloyl-ACP methyl ester carboxylesterase